MQMRHDEQKIELVRKLIESAFAEIARVYDWQVDHLTFCDSGIEKFDEGPHLFKCNGCHEVLPCKS